MVAVTGLLAVGIVNRPRFARKPLAIVVNQIKLGNRGDVAAIDSIKSLYADVSARARSFKSKLLSAVARIKLPGQYRRLACKVKCLTFVTVYESFLMQQFVKLRLF